MIIAIDGPAGSGKSSTARAVAQRLGFRHLDSGAFYRAITCAAMRRGIPPERWERLTAAELGALRVSAEPAEAGFRMLIDGHDVSQEIRSAEVNARVSAMASVPAVRDWLLETLRATGRSGNLVADGRDIGTVVFPGAELKVFLVADPAARAHRRLLQMGLPTDPPNIDAEVRRIEERDALDSSRAAAPLRQAEDARVLDTTRLGFEEQVGRIVDWARQLRRGRGREEVDRPPASG
jgi:CMP/dCMP kinase